VGDQIEAVAPGGAVLTLTGFTRSDIRAFDVTDPNAPLELTAAPISTADGYGITVQLAADGGSRIVRAQSSAAAASTPDAVTANVASSICQSAGAEVAVIAPRAFFPALAPWVTARSAAGWSVELDDIEDVFDEMTYGAHQAAAITSFVRLRRGGAAPRTRYLLLAGGASFDPRNFLGKNAPDLVPTALIDTDAIETASDEALADLDGDGLAELAVGRWPSRTPDDLAALVAATLALDGQGPFDRGALIVTGTSGDPSFLAAADQLAAVLPAAPDRYDPSGLAAASAAAGLATHWSAGPSFVQYFGHGSEQIWEGLLSVGTATSLGAPGRPAVVCAMTCLNGLFQDVYQDCLAEDLLQAPGAAVAVWASADLYDAGAQAALAANFAASARSMALGSAAHAARVATGGAGRAMILFGDPTLFGAPTPTSGSAADGAADSGAPSDAGATPDAGGPFPPAGTGGSSTGVPEAGNRGCSCAIGGGAAPDRSSLFLVALLASLVLRRRRA
jgi:MYXO-CTERM domain-containing protein